MFACCVPDPKQEAEVVETKTLPVLSEKAIQVRVDYTVESTQKP